LPHSKTHKLFRLVPAALVAAALLLIPGALAVHNENLFELDIGGTPVTGQANVADNSGAGLPDDWVNVCKTNGIAGCAAFSPDSALASVFVADSTDPTDVSYFTGGGTKDERDIPSWMHTATDQAPDKDEIIDAFAAAYQKTSGSVTKTFLYFGLDRFDTSGDSQVGFWFFQNAIGEVNPGGDGGFSGQHKVGDILVLSDFVKGGKVGRTAVYEWVGGKNPLQLLFASNASDCSVVSSTDNVCAVVNNTGGEDPPWAYVNKDGESAYEAGALYEGGINLSAFFPTGVPCFSTFLSETRSSQSTDAQLKDYALGNFNLCPVKAGVKFHDLDADGVKEAGEAGLNGWTIRIYKDTNGDGVLDPNGVDNVLGNADDETLVSSAVTATLDGVDGSYRFVVEPGKYVVCEVLQAGWFQSLPTSGSQCSAVAALGARGYGITLGLGDEDLNNDFGNYQNATKSGTKYHDLNADGDRDEGEPGLSGWTIKAFVDSDGDGVLDAGETTVGGSDVTDANGDYSISLTPGKYVVCEVLQAGWIQSEPAGNTKCAADTSLGAAGYAEDLSSNESVSGNDFGNYQNATKSGLKFEDENADGDRDVGELGLSGWVIHLFGTDGAGNPVHETDTTDASGNYSFTVNPGSYTVCEELKSGWTQSHPTSGADCSGHNHGDTIVPGPLGYSIVLDSGEIDSGNDFGNFRQASKSGVKFEDDNADGDRDAGEDGLSGWTINAYADDGDGVLSAAEAGATPVAFATTVSGGSYTLSLTPGRYVICEELKAGWSQSKPSNNRCATGSALGPGGYAENLTSGDEVTGNDFGNFRRATKSGIKWNDKDEDGVRDAGEPALAGWVIHLFGTDGMGNAVHEHDTTDASGQYSFSVNPGSYTVCEAQQATWEQSYPSSGADCSTHGAGMAPFGYAITLESGQVDSDNDFGNFQPPQAQLAHTQTTCADFVSGNAAEITEVLYGSRRGVINNVAPGVFFYYTQVTAPSSSFSIVIDQSNNNATFPLFQIQNGQVSLYDANCNPSNKGTVVLSANGTQATINITGASAGEVFIIGVKYSTGSVVGTSAAGDPTVTYTYKTKVGATPGTAVEIPSLTDSLQLKKKP
jgi:hypothetical protein